MFLTRTLVRPWSRIALATLGAAFALSAQVPNFTPPTPLFAAILRLDPVEVKRLLDAGANPNEGVFIGAPPLVFGIMQGNNAICRSLLEKGADPKGTDGAGSTALMWAAANEAGDPSLVEELLLRGVDPNAANKMGDTALVWALRRGHEPVIAALHRHGASNVALVQQSVTRAIDLLQKSGVEFIKVSGCTSCHHQSLPQMAYGIARKRGFAADPQISDKQVKAVLGMVKPLREQVKNGSFKFPDPAISLGYTLVGLAAENYPPDADTEVMAQVVAGEQTADGGFLVMSARPPIESSAFTATALGVRSLQVYGKSPAERVARAAQWLRTAKPRTNEDRAMQVLGLAWAGASVRDLRAPVRALLAEQRSDGGWAQLPALESDAYASGQALAALAAAGQAVDSAPYRRGADFLLRTQRPDGSWLVRSRAFAFQPLKESGFPHGKDQWISAAGTSWAVMALAHTATPAPLQLSRR